MRFLVDIPLSPALAQWLIDQGHDAIHASAAGLDRSSDSDIIDRARAEARTIIIADLDYPRLLALAGSTSPSLIVFRSGNWADNDVIRRIRELLESVSASDIEQSILIVDRNRVRRRRLPI